MIDHTISTYQNRPINTWYGALITKFCRGGRELKNDIKTQIGFDNYKHSLQQNTNKQQTNKNGFLQSI